MTRPSATQIDDAILDAAAGLFASHGVAGTSVAQIAGAVGYSKTGLLHRFATKQALVDAVLVDTRTRLDAVTTALADEPAGPARDVAAVRAIAEVALERPGQIALVLAAFTAGPAAVATEVTDPLLADVESSISTLFGGAMAPDPADAAEVERASRVATALAGIAVTTPLLAQFAHAHGATTARRLITTVALDALGTPRSSR